MLKAALSGGYVNFGVLRLYGDDALDNAIRIFVKLLESIEQRDIMVTEYICFIISKKTCYQNISRLLCICAVIISL